MKKIKVALVALVLAGLTLTSCGGSDDSGTAASIQAKWTQTKTVVKVGTSPNISQNYTDNEPGCDKDYIEFTAAGFVNDVIFFKNASNACVTDAATPSPYTKSATALTITGGDYDGVYNVEKLTGSQLVIKSVETVGGNEITTSIYFNKVN